MIVCYISGLTGKLHSIWEGPYEVLSKLLDCNHRIAVPEKRSHNLVVHANRLKECCTPAAKLFWVVVAEENEGTTESVGKIKMGTPVLSGIQPAQLQIIIDEFPDVITVKLGMV